MNYYYSFIDFSKNPDVESQNKYQLPIRYHGSTPKEKIPSQIAVDDLDGLFISHLFTQDITEVKSFLDYHFQMYSGKKEDFISHTSFIIDGYITPKEINSKVPIMSPFQSVKYPVNKEMKKHIEKWLLEKEPLSLNAKSETPSDNKIKKTTFKERFVYLRELGFFELKLFKDSTPIKKEKLLSKILDCNIDYARDLIINNIHKYSKDEKNGIKDETIEKVKNEINK